MLVRERIIILQMENMPGLALGNMVSATTAGIYGPNLLSICCVNGPRAHVLDFGTGHYAALR